jgi:hypothetical protein
VDCGIEESIKKEAAVGEEPPEKPCQQLFPKPGPPPTAKTVEPLGNTDAEMSDLTNSMSALRFVPTSVRFGRGRGKVGFSKH